MVYFRHNDHKIQELMDRLMWSFIIKRRKVAVKSRHIFAHMGLFAVLALSGCAATDPEQEYYDPAEPANRVVHSFNKGVDTIALKPISQAYGYVTPDPVEDAVANFGSNIGAPADAVNHLLQGNLKSSAQTVGRFGVNSTIGILGLMDPATAMGLPLEDTDFDDTLGKWGIGEGPYVELPLLGPSTARGTIGQVVDFVTDPVSNLLNAPESDYLLAAKGLEIIDTRHRYAEAIDPALYESADSYTTSRNAYLQNKRRTVKGQTDEDDLEDPFALE